MRFGRCVTDVTACWPLQLPCTLMYMEVEATEMKTADVRHDLAEVINAAATKNRITYITNRGRRIAAVVPLHVAEQAEQKK